MGKGRNGLENEQSALFATVVSLGAALLGGGAKLSNKMSETKLGLRELFNEINLLKGKIKNVADFVKANYESLHQSDSPVFAILNAIYI